MQTTPSATPFCHGLRLADMAEPQAGATLDEHMLVGRWESSDPDAIAPAIRWAELLRHEGELQLSMLGVDGFDWGRARVERVFTAGPAATLAVGLTATFELPQRRARVHGNIKLGVMVLAAFVRFDASASERRPPCFTRDFLFQPGGPGGPG
jgi:hypothetical protein